MRIGLALSTVPFVQKNIIDRVALLASRAKGSPAQQVPSAAEMRQQIQFFKEQTRQLRRDGAGGVPGGLRSAPEIVGDGLGNLANEPTGWFFGRPSPLYSNQGGAAATAPQPQAARPSDAIAAWEADARAATATAEAARRVAAMEAERVAAARAEAVRLDAARATWGQPPPPTTTAAQEPQVVNLNEQQLDNLMGGLDSMPPGDGEAARQAWLDNNAAQPNGADARPMAAAPGQGYVPYEQRKGYVGRVVPTGGQQQVDQEAARKAWLAKMQQVEPVQRQ